MRSRLLRMCAGAVLVAAALVPGQGCTSLVGTGSFTLMTRDASAVAAKARPTGEVVEESETWTWLLILFFFGQNPTHESVVARLLEKHDADVLVDAEVESTIYGVPYIFMQSSTVARGKPARIARGGGL
jgi:hypothetical protein